MRLCACCGDSYKAEWVLSGDEPPQTSATSSEKTAEGTKRRMFQLIDSRSWAIGLAIAGGLGFVAMAWPQLATSFKRAQYLEQIQPLMKSMTELSIATEDGLTMRKYRDLLLKVKVDYEDTDRFGLMGVFPNAADSIERAMACYNGTSFLWYDMQPGRDAGLNYADLLGFMNEGFGDELSEKVRSAIIKRKTPISVALNDSDLKRELISLFFTSASRHLGEAKRSLKE